MYEQHVIHIHNVCTLRKKEKKQVIFIIFSIQNANTKINDLMVIIGLDFIE